MNEERIALSGLERERLKVLHEVEVGHLKQVEAAERLGLSPRQVRRLERRVKAEGDRGLVHRRRGRPSNRKIPAGVFVLIYRFRYFHDPVTKYIR